MKLPSPLLIAAAASTAYGAVQKVTRVGRYMYTADVNWFYVKDIAYQTQDASFSFLLYPRQIISGPDNPLDQSSTFVDNLADAAGCVRDLPFLQQLGVNAIRAYSVDSTLNHDLCMVALREAGIYVILDLTLLLNGSIDTTLPTRSTNLLDQARLPRLPRLPVLKRLVCSQHIKTINVLERRQRPRLQAYNVGNEVLTASDTNAAPFVKAAARDVKAYLTSFSSSAPVGYADIDGASGFRDAVA
ncbi:Glucanosyltransferase-domain-containing protein [Mycena sanguinolenta]|nr:Glucanosyltransferase-domain-containing protein [Mycena sanguinolenta]